MPDLSARKRITVSGYGESLYEVKRSKFIGYCKPVLTAQEANDFVDEIRRKHADARHNVYAWILKKEISLQKYSDDGEPSGTAGLPVMSVLTKNEITDCAIVVTRYFGGILLGKGGLVRAYTKAAALALKEAGPKVMEMCAVMNFRCDYSSYDRLVFEIKNHGYVISRTDFGADVDIDVTVPLDMVEGFCDFMIQVSNGTIEVVKQGEIEAQTEEVRVEFDESEDDDEFP